MDADAVAVLQRSAAGFDVVEEHRVGTTEILDEEGLALADDLRMFAAYPCGRQTDFAFRGTADAEAGFVKTDFAHRLLVFVDQEFGHGRGSTRVCLRPSSAMLLKQTIY